MSEQLVHESGISELLDQNEKVLWCERQSHMVNLKAYVINAALFVLAVILFVFLYPSTLLLSITTLALFSRTFILALLAHKTIFVLTNQRFIEKKGVLTRTIKEVELYRVRDYMQTSTIIERIVKLGTVIINTNDNYDTVIVIRGISSASKLQGLFRKYTELCRKSSGVREFSN